MPQVLVVQLGVVVFQRWDPPGSPRLFLYDSEGRPSAGAPLVPCDAWKDASPQQKQDLRLNPEDVSLINL